MSTVYNRASFELAHERMRRAPLALTDADLSQLAIIDPALETKAYEAKRQAQLAIVQQHTPIQTKAAATTPMTGGSMTTKTLLRFADQLMDHVLAPVFRSHKQKLEALEQRIKELERRPMLKYAGIWQAGETYVEGRLVTHAGGLWLSTEATAGTPGTAASGFRLIVKRGEA